MGKSNISSERKAQVIYFSHGGGPLPILGDPRHQKMIAFMKNLPTRIKKPDTVVVISAHWEEQAATLLGAKSPQMFYDYYGFPEESYSIKYPAPGAPELAKRIADLLAKKSINSGIDEVRGFDHGLFIPLKMMYPDADIPCIQLSLMRGLDPVKHIELGKALRGLLNENILFIGSGFSFHNLRAFSWDGGDDPDPQNDAFQDWLIDTITSPVKEKIREQKLTGWVRAPFARYCHPREEHLLPLHVCAGISGNEGELVFNDYIFGKRSVAFLWK